MLTTYEAALDFSEGVLGADVPIVTMYTYLLYDIHDDTEQHAVVSPVSCCASLIPSEVSTPCIMYGV